MIISRPVPGTSRFLTQMEMNEFRRRRNPRPDRSSRNRLASMIRTSARAVVSSVALISGADRFACGTNESGSTLSASADKPCARTDGSRSATIGKSCAGQMPRRAHGFGKARPVCGFWPVCLQDIRDKSARLRRADARFPSGGQRGRRRARFAIHARRSQDRPLSLRL